MAALLGANIDKASALAAAAADGEVCEVANDNDPTQVVISGHKSAIDRITSYNVCYTKLLRTISRTLTEP